MVKKPATEQAASAPASSPVMAGFSAARSSQAGDICVMLAADALSIPLQQHLDQLRQLLGGHPPDLVHVTLQRFAVPAPNVAPKVGINLVHLVHQGMRNQRVNFQSSLHQELIFDAEPYFSQEMKDLSGVELAAAGSAGLAPLTIQADGFLPVHSDFRKLHLLKWRVPGTPELARLYQWVDELGLQVGAQPIYSRHTADAMVTALLDIVPESIEDVANLAHISIPRPLFLGSLLVTSRIMGPNHFEILGESSL